MISIKDGVSLKELVESVVQAVWKKYGSEEPVLNVEDEAVDTSLAELARRQLFFRELSESFKGLSDKLGEQLIEQAKDQPSIKTLRLADCGYRLTLTERVDIEIDHNAIDPFLQRNGLYDQCLKETLNTKKITTAMIREYFPPELQESAVSKEFDKERFVGLLNTSVIRLEEVQPFIKDATKYSLTRAAYKPKDKE